MNTEYRKAYYQKYKFSPDGLVASMYNGQLATSRKRKHPKPNYSLKELRIFVFSLENFNFLFNQWKENNFSREYTPSLDRIDPTQPYTFNNLQLCSWSENRKKRFSDQLFVVKSDNSSNVTGVSYNTKSNKWVAQMIVNQTHIWLGQFSNKEDAIIARIRGDLEHNYLTKENFENYISSLVDNNELSKKYSIDEILPTNQPQNN